MEQHFIFCHGWGSSPALWHPLRPFVENCTFWNLGYNGEPLSLTKPSGKAKAIGIGHSLGFAKLLESGYPFDALIGIQTFTKFKPDVSLMLNAFQKDPLATIQKFSKITGIPLPINHFCYDRLREDLMWLQHVDVSERLTMPHLVLASLDDPIIPIESIYEQFQNVLTHPRGLHNLIAQDPKWCAQNINAHDLFKK